MDMSAILKYVKDLDKKHLKMIADVKALIRKVKTCQTKFIKHTGAYTIGSPVTLIKMEFENVTGHIYIDHLLTSYSIPIDYSYPVNVRIDSFEFCLVGSVGPFDSDRPEYYVVLNVKATNLEKANSMFNPYPEELTFEYDLRKMDANWISDARDTRGLGFAEFRPFLGQLGIVLIFDNDRDRREVVRHSMRIFRLINEKFGSSIGFNYVSGDWLQEKRSKLIREFTQ
jgi:hypothetical protein